VQLHLGQSNMMTRDLPNTRIIKGILKKASQQALKKHTKLIKKFNK
jgi:hypothetical protein